MQERVDADFSVWEAGRQRSASDWFAPGSVSVARAPGRLDVMGGIADYSGSLVAEMPIADAAVCGAQPDPAGTVSVRTLVPGEGIAAEVVFPAECFVNPVTLLRHLRDADPADRWAGYAAGTVAILRAEGEIRRGVGARLLLRSDVPVGAGVSSSAALEVAAMRAVADAFGCALDGKTLARWCQRIENEILDAPCGIMDQMTSALGTAGELLLLRCDPHTVEGALPVPDGWTVLGIDSGVKHSVAGAGYTGVRVAAFMGAKILSDRAGTGFGGWLCRVGSARYRELVRGEPLPETMGGAEFLARHGGILDAVTHVESDLAYPVRAATEHPIHEVERVERFVECLRDASPAGMAEAGAAMRASHASYSACGLGAAETDLLVELACDGPGAGVVAGAKITGGGSGGTVCLLCPTGDADRVARDVTEEYRRRTGLAARVVRGTSPGAMATPVRRLSIP